MTHTWSPSTAIALIARVAAVLPIGVDLNRAHGEHERPLPLRAASVDEAVLGHDLARVGERRRPQFDVLQPTRRLSQSATTPSASAWLTLAQPGAPCSAPPSRTSGVIWGEPRRGSTIAIFVEQRLLALIEFAQRRPIDLAAEQRLRIELAAPRLRRPLQLPDRHAILVEDAQLELVDDGAVGRARLMHGQAKIAARRRAPPETVRSSVAGLDAAHLAKGLAVVGEMRREHRSVSLAPFDQRAERRPHGAEVDRNALADGNFHRAVAQRGEAARLAHRGGLLGRVEVDFDDLRPALGRRVLARPANEPRFDRGEGEYVLSALAMARAAEIGPRLAVERRREAIVRRRALAPIDFQPAERRDRAEIDLEPRPVGRLRPSTRSRSCRRRRAGGRRCWRRLAIGAWAGLSSESFRRRA